MTPHQAFTLWDATFGTEDVGGGYRSRNEAAQIAYSAVFSVRPNPALDSLCYYDADRRADLMDERRTAAAHLREWANALEEV